MTTQRKIYADMFKQACRHDLLKYNAVFHILFVYFKNYTFVYKININKTHAHL